MSQTHELHADRDDDHRMNHPTCSDHQELHDLPYSADTSIFMELVFTV